MLLAVLNQTASGRGVGSWRRVVASGRGVGSWRRVSFQFLVRLFIVNKFVHLVVVVLLVHDHSYSSFVGRK